MSRRTTVIKLEVKSPDTFLTLCESVVEYNQQLGAASPLAGDNLVDMTDFEQRVQLARETREKAILLYAEAESLMSQSRNLIGSAAGQSSTTSGTLYCYMVTIKKLLLAIYTQNPMELTMWGFNVVMKTARSPKRRKNPVTE